MILITGHSHKLDGVAFVADTDDHATALKMMRDAWNAQFTDQMKIVVTDKGDYLISAECEAECVRDFEDDTPRREGFALFAQEYEPGTIIQRCAW